MKRKLDLGCGRNKAPEAVGVDSNPDAAAADVLADLNRPLPFPADTFEEVRAVHVIEHVRDIVQTMAEIHRVAIDGARLFLVTPHYTDSGSWRDPTHRWHLNTYSFRFWEARGLHHERHWYTRLELREVSLRVELARLWKCAGFQWLVNRSQCFRRFWEQYLCFIIRGKQMEFTFEVVKNGECQPRRSRGGAARLPPPFAKPPIGCLSCRCDDQVGSGSVESRPPLGPFSSDPKGEFVAAVSDRRSRIFKNFRRSESAATAN